MMHISDMDLERYLDGVLGKVASFMLERHVNGCAECRARMENVRSERAYLASMRAGLKRLEDADEDVERSSIGRSMSGN